MKKKVIAWIAVAALSVSALTGCGSKGADDKTIKVAATASTSCRDPGGSKASVRGAGLYSGGSGI